MDIFDLLVAIIVGLIIYLLGLVWAFPIMILWNLLMPQIFGLPQLTYWQTFGLYILVNMLIPHIINNSNK